MGFSRLDGITDSMDVSLSELRESESPFPSPEDLPDPGIEPMFPESPVLADRFFTSEPTGKARIRVSK